MHSVIPEHPAEHLEPEISRSQYSTGALWQCPDVKRRNIISATFSIKVVRALIPVQLSHHRTMKTALAAVFSLGCGLAVAFPAGEHQQTRLQPPPTELTPPSRPLVWGDLNIIHTTDTHGWLLGHQKLSPPEPNYRFALSPQQFLGTLTSLFFQRNFRRLRFVRFSYERNCQGVRA